MLTQIITCKCGKKYSVSVTKVNYVKMMMKSGITMKTNEWKQGLRLAKMADEVDEATGKIEFSKMMTKMLEAEIIDCEDKTQFDCVCGEKISLINDLN